MREERVVLVAFGLLCAAGFASSLSETVDAWLSTAATWLLVGGGVVVVVVAGVWEVWQAVKDWRAFGPPDLGPLRRRMRQTEREETR